MSRGKYAKVIDQLPRMLGSEPAYQEKVNAVKEAMRKEEGFQQAAIWLAHEYASLRLEQERKAEALSECNLRLEAMTQMMSEQFEVEGISSVKLPGVGGISTFMEPYAQVQDRDQFREWCMADADLRKLMALPWQSTNSLTKQRLLDGEPEPPGVTVFAKTKVRFTGA